MILRFFFCPSQNPKTSQPPILHNFHLKPVIALHGMLITGTELNPKPYISKKTNISEVNTLNFTSPEALQGWECAVPCWVRVARKDVPAGAACDAALMGGWV